MVRKLTALCGVVAALLAGPCAPAAGATLRAPGGGAVRALVIGIDQYPNLPSSAWLHGAAADAKDIAQALAAVGVDARLLTDRNAVRPRVVAEMDRLVGESKSGDLVIVSYAGHGMRVGEYPQWKGIDKDRASSQIVLSGYGRSGDAAHDIIVDKEMRAWLARFDAKGVDALVVMDSCYGGAMRAMVVGKIAIRTISDGAEQANHDSFVGIPMSQKEARADVEAMPHVTFLAGADKDSVVPEMTGFDAQDPTAARGALSYFVARAIEGVASDGGDVTRETLFKFLPQQVTQATNQRQRVDLEPRSDDPAVLRKVVLRFAGGGPAVTPEPAPPRPPALQADPVRVAVVNGSASSFATVEKGRAPFVEAQRLDAADLVWDVRNSEASSRGDAVMSKVDGSLLGGVIDRTWAIRQIQKLALARVLTVRLLEGGKLYTQRDHPVLIVEGVRESYLTVVNIAADGTVQMQFPTRAGDDQPIRADGWTSSEDVVSPFGADHVVAVAGSRPAAELVEWLKAHDGTRDATKRDAALLPAVIAGVLASDPAARIGTVGLYTSAGR
jgi:hypothetical protein